MFKKPKQEKTPLDEVIEDVYSELRGYQAKDKEFKKATDRLEALYKIKAANKPESVDRNTLAVVAGNLVGILMIINHERINVITSKAVSFVLKPK